MVSYFPRVGPTQSIGDVMPDVQLPLVAGGGVTLSGRLRERRGAVVLFWSAGCAHCVRYDGYLNSFEQRHPDIALIAVAARRTETIDQIRLTVAERGLDFPLAYGGDAGTATAWIAPQTPRAYLVDRDRALVYRGAIDNYKYETDPAHAAYLEPALNDFRHGRPLARPDTPSFGCAIESVYYLLPKITR